MAFTGIDYPGLELFGGIYVNLYTAPALMAGSISVVGIILLIFFFNGKMRLHNSKKKIHPKETKNGNSSELQNNGNSIPLREITPDEKEDSDSDSRRDSIIEITSVTQGDPDFLGIANLPLDTESTTDSEPKIPYNIPAISVLIFTKVVGELVMLNLSTIIPPYIMTAFQWSSAEAVKMQSVMMGCVGALIILFSSAFVFLKLGTK